MSFCKGSRINKRYVSESIGFVGNCTKGFIFSSETSFRVETIVFLSFVRNLNVIP